LQFRVLGPLEVLDNGRVVPVSGSRQRGLLAMLLLNAGRVVSSDRLLDELWGDAPPQSGVTALQVRISQLRKSLGGDAIRTRGPGYSIELASDEFDLHVFERLVERAAGEAPEAASATLRDALGLWRGPPLADFAYEAFAQPAIGRLEELRLAAVEKRVDADLAVGRHAELVPELELLIAEHPLRERFRAQLMLAFYRSARQADALELFQHTRRTLVEEVGLEPGPALRDLERAILRQDHTLNLVADLPRPQRSIMVAPLAGGSIGVLLELAILLGRRPPADLILVRVCERGDDLVSMTAGLREHRDRAVAAGLKARVAAFSSSSPAEDVGRLVVDQDVDLLLVDAPPGMLDDPILAHLLRSAPCDVAILVRGELRNAPILVPFTGAEHDWTAIELAAWAAVAQGQPLQIAGPAVTASGGGERDASRLLANASLAIQAALGVQAEPLIVEPGDAGLLRAASGSGLLVVGLSDRWQKSGLGSVRGALAARALPATVLVRRGVRPGGLAPRERLTRFTWSLGPPSP
jgi:DNA-binding SARP family transcriptional activator